MTTALPFYPSLPVPLAAPAASNRGPRVLIVDDDDLIQECVAIALRERHFDVRTAGNGREALDALTLPNAVSPDVILVDMQMPVMDGPEFARAYRRLPGATASLIGMSADTEVRGALGTAALDAYAVLAKPVAVKDVVDVVSRCVADARRRGA